MEETKIIYYIDEEETPYLIKIPSSADKVTLGDFKNALNRPNYKFFFKSMDDDFGVVKEEIIDDEIHLPCLNGRVVSWLVTAEGSNLSDGKSTTFEKNSDKVPMLTANTRPSLLLNRGPSVNRNVADHRDGVDNESCDTYTDTDSIYSTGQDRVAPLRNFYDYKQHAKSGVRATNSRLYPNRLAPSSETASSMMSSDLESTSFFDSEDESSRFSTATGTTMSSKYGHHRQRRQYRRRRMPPISRASSFSSVTDSSMSLNVISVTINMDKVNFLGISIVGQSKKDSDGGIYVGNIMDGGAVAADGRIEPGDMILEVNGVDFQDMSNDDAVNFLREQVHKSSSITLVVAKCWDNGTKGYLSIPRGEPVRPIDPRAWVLHTNAMTQGDFPPGPMAAPSISTMTSSRSSRASSLPESERYLEDIRPSVDSDMLSVVRMMAQPDSGLEIRNRLWLKITIPNAFIGSDLVDWLYCHVDGFSDRRDARKYSCDLLKAGYIRHTVNKVSFSEQCYYIFGDLSALMSSLSLEEEVDSISETLDRDTLAPLPPPTWGQSSAPPPTYPPHGCYGNVGSSFNYSTDTTSQYSSLPPASYVGVMGQVNSAAAASSVLSGSGSSGSDRSRRSAGLRKTSSSLPHGMLAPTGLHPQHPPTYFSNGAQHTMSGKSALPVAVPMVPMSAAGMEYSNLTKAMNGAKSSECHFAVSTGSTDAI